MPVLANASFLNCNLTLNLIEGTHSSEMKQLYFEAEMNGNQQSRMAGTLNTVSCFGTNFQQFKSETARITQDELNDSKVTIGNYSYRFKLKFAPLEGSTLSVTGKIIPLDDRDIFFHQIVTGTCRISEQPASPFGFLDVARIFVINYQRRSVCR